MLVDVSAKVKLSQLKKLLDETTRPDFEEDVVDSLKEYFAIVENLEYPTHILKRSNTVLYLEWCDIDDDLQLFIDDVAKLPLIIQSVLVFDTEQFIGDSEQGTRFVRNNGELVKIENNDLEIDSMDTLTKRLAILQE